MKRTAIVFILFFALFSVEVLAQKYLILDRYTTKRTKLQEGDEIWFRQIEDKTRFHDYIGQLKDSSLMLGASRIEMPLSNFQTFYFPNHLLRSVSAQTNFVAGGFLFAAAIEPLVGGGEFYSASEAAIIGASFFVLGQTLKLFRWKKFRVTKNARVRIVDTTFR